jgi:hypothetical protein
MNHHLSSAEISEWIAGERTAEIQRHVRECPICHAELTGFEADLSAFGQSVRQWAAEQETRQSYRELPSASWRWAWGTAAILAVALLPAYWHRQVPIDATLQDDELLLENVDVQLSRMVPASMEPLLNLMSLPQERKDDRE